MIVIILFLCIQVPQDPSVLRKDIYFCKSCNQYKPSTEFQLTSNSQNVGQCRKCIKIDNDGRVRQDYSQYRCSVGLTFISNYMDMYNHVLFKFLMAFYISF